MLVLCLGIVYTYSCVLPGYKMPNSWRDRALKSRALNLFLILITPTQRPQDWGNLIWLSLASFLSSLVINMVTFSPSFYSVFNLLFSIWYSTHDQITERTELWIEATWLISFPLSLCKKRQFRIFAYIHFFQLLMFNYINKKHLKKELVSHPLPKRINFWSQVLNFVSMNCWKWRPNQYGINPN